MMQNMAGWAVPVWILGAPFVLVIVETLRARSNR